MTGVCVLSRVLQGGASLDSILDEVFAVVREASWRVLKLRHYDVQMVGGMALHDGKLAEMNTGEGKTLVASLASYLNALEGKGVHVVTVNDYLARRDSENIGQIHKSVPAHMSRKLHVLKSFLSNSTLAWRADRLYRLLLLKADLLYRLLLLRADRLCRRRRRRFLGLTVGLIQADMKPEERKTNYACDITYVTNSELGFDFLRDNLALSPDQMVLGRPLNM